MERSCLDCGKALVGRSDKKFFDDSCRNNNNNHRKSDDTIVIKEINLILKKNRTLLLAFNPIGKIKVYRKKLAAVGFNFDYHTHILIKVEPEVPTTSAMNMAYIYFNGVAYI